MAKRATPKLISLYTGAGGLDYGFEAAGFETAVAVEWDREACATLAKNRPWPVIQNDIHAVPTAEILERAGLKQGEADLLIGGPPCQPWSKSGYWAHGDSLRLDDPRAATVAAYLRVVEETLPETFVMENVPGIAYAKKDEGLKLILGAIRDINRRHGTKYQPNSAVLHAKFYGVPQDRTRFFLVASRSGRAFEFPAYTHGSENDHVAEGAGPLFSTLSIQCSGTMEPLRTAWDALGDLPVDGEPGEDLAMRGKWAKLLPSIPEGENYLFHTDRGGGLPLFGWRRRYWNFLLKLAKDRPAWTLQAQPGPAVGPFHWRSRRLSMRELCRLQTFPDDVVIVGGRGAGQRQVGNAVPSLLAEVLGRGIRAQLLPSFGPAKSPLRLLPPRRIDLPPPEPLAKVPKQFLELVGEHEAHPGTGKGYGAAQTKRRRAKTTV